MVPMTYFGQNHIMSDSHITVPRDESPMRNSAIQIEADLKRYSDELANGDNDDDRDNQAEHDMNDTIVDVNGHTNAGYGS